MANSNIDNGWFTETEAMWPGQKFSLALANFDTEKILYDQRSPFQNILVFQSAQYGNVLVLDGVIQLTEMDNFAYHEMMTHLALCSVRIPPRRILIVGGGDGYLLREILTQYDCVSQIVIVEIDAMVVHVARQFFGAVFDHAKVELIHADAAVYLRNCKDQFDVILGDTSDPVGPAASLFSPEFYDTMRKSLKPGGMVCVQAECFWIHLELISDLIACCRDTFGSAEYATTMVPTYPCGQIGFVLARTDGRSSSQIVRQPKLPERLKWYSPAIHTAAFALPPFVSKELDQHLPVNGYQAFVDSETALSHEPDCFLSKCTIQ